MSSSATVREVVALQLPRSQTRQRDLREMPVGPQIHQAQGARLAGA